MQKYYIVSKQGWAVIGREVLRGRASTRQRVIMSITYGKFGCTCVKWRERAHATITMTTSSSSTTKAKVSINKINSKET